MYNRILNRPMFKLGGKTVTAQGTGITSGLDAPRQGYAENSFVEKLSEIDVGVSPELKKRAFWSGIGEGFSNARTLGDALSGAVKGQEAILGPAEAEAAKRRFEIDVAGVKMPYERETLTILQEMGDENKKEVQLIANKATATAQKIEAVKAKYRKEDGSLDTSDPNYQAEITTITQGFNLEKEALGLAKILIQTTYPDLNTDEGIKQLTKQLMTIIAIVQSGAKTSKATGGRIGYQFGATNQGVQPMEASLNVDETIQTPTETVQEDVSVKEKIQPSVNMTYHEFRAKMPPQVDDEIVQLIYYNQDAFADFAQIKTQDEVYAFNNKWGVSLVLPFDTETT
jgi:hypothetical protein